MPTTADVQQVVDGIARRAERVFAAEGFGPEDETFIAELAKLGVDDIDEVVCDTNSVGNFEFPEQKGKRLARATCYLNEADSTNFYARPIESLSLLIDLNAREVVEERGAGLDGVPARGCGAA